MKAAPRDHAGRTRQDLYWSQERIDAKARLAAMRERMEPPPKAGPLDRLQDAIVEAMQLAGGSVEELKLWRMTR